MTLSSPRPQSFSAASNALSTLARALTPGVSRLVLSPNGQTLAALSSVPAEVSVIDLNSHQTLQRLALASDSQPVGATFVGNGSYLVVVGRDSVAQVWNVARGTQEAVLRGHAQAVRALATNREASRLVTVGEDSRLLVWDTARGLLLHAWPAGSERIASVAYSPDGRQLALAGGSPRILLLDAQGGKPLQVLSSASAEVDVVTFSPNGHWLASADAAGRLALWPQEPATQRFPQTPTAVFTTSAGAARALAFSADSRLLISGGDDGVLRLWDVASGQQLRTFTAGPSGINTLAFAPGSVHTVMAGTQDHRIVFWDLVTGEKDIATHVVAVDR